MKPKEKKEKPAGLRGPAMPIAKFRATKANASRDYRGMKNGVKC